jgi:hypothetical protein
LCKNGRQDFWLRRRWLANIRRESLPCRQDIVIGDSWLFVHIAIAETRDKVKGSRPFRSRAHFFVVVLDESRLLFGSDKVFQSTAMVDHFH